VATYAVGVAEMPSAVARTRAGRGVLFAVVLVAGFDLLFWVARGLGAFGGPVPV
jgi:hypothetical protein